MSSLAGALSLLLLASAAGAAQWPGDQEIPSIAFPQLPTSGPEAASFVPAGWTLEAQARGDLNADRRPDAALVLHMDNARNRIHPSWDQSITYDTNPRMLVIIFAVPTGGYRLAAADHALIPRLENPNQDDAFDSIAIAGGALKVRLKLFMNAGGWRMGDAMFTLRWNDEAMRLIGYDADWTERNSGKTEVISVNFLTGRKVVNIGSIERDGVKTSEGKAKRKPLLKLGQIGDGLMFDPATL